jgi:Cu+-exporting ATPase
MKAVVFDVAGTLLRRIREVKDINKNVMDESNSTLEIVDELGNSALVVIQTSTENCIMKANPKMKFYDFLNRYNINIDISYSSSNVSKNELLKLLKQDNTLIEEFQDVAKVLNKNNKSIQICSGSAFLFDLNTKKIKYTIAAGGELFPNVLKVVDTLKNQGIDIFIASGDRSQSLYEIGEMINIPKENIFPTTDTEGKKDIIKKLKEKYEVMMVGNGPNDILALKESDISVLTLEQNEPVSEKLKNSAKFVINDIIEVLDIKF